MLVHETDQICFCEKSRFGRLAFVEPTLCRNEGLPLLEVWYFLVRPFVVREYVQVVPLPDNEAYVLVQLHVLLASQRVLTGGVELLLAVLHIYRCQPASRILGTAREEATRDILVHSLLVPSEVPCMRGGMNWGMRVIIVFALPRSIEASILQA